MKRNPKTSISQEELEIILRNALGKSFISLNRKDFHITVSNYGIDLERFVILRKELRSLFGKNLDLYIGSTTENLVIVVETPEQVLIHK